MKATLRNYRQAPRKVRLVATLIKGKPVTVALDALTALPKRAALPLRKLVLSAVSNAARSGGTKETLSIKDIRVDKGFVFKRYMPRARGRAALIRKESSHVYLELGPKVEKEKKSRAKKETAPVAATTPTP